jgi:hypothetical protein
MTNEDKLAFRAAVELEWWVKESFNSVPKDPINVDQWVSNVTAAMAHVSSDCAWAFFLAYRKKFIEPSEAIAAIKVAPGNRAWAFYCCGTVGIMPKAEALEWINKSPGNRDFSLSEAKRDKWVGL